MKFDLKILTLLLTILLLGGIAWLIRWVYQTIKRKFEQDIELHKLRIDNIHMAASLRERNQVAEELYQAHMKAGRGDGYMEVVDHLLMLSRGEGATERYKDLSESYTQQLSHYAKELEESIGQQKGMRRELEQLRGLRGDIQNELARLRLISKSERQKRVANASESRQNPVGKPLTGRQKGVAKPSESRHQRVSDGISREIGPFQGDSSAETLEVEEIAQENIQEEVPEEKTREMYPVFQLMDKDTRYKLRASLDMSRIHVINKRNGHEVEVVAAASLQKGKTYKVAKAVYLIWCELEGCDCLKITQSPTARACTRDHMNQLTLLDRQKQQFHGS